MQNDKLKFKIITTIIIFVIFLFVGYLSLTDVKCPEGVSSWRCGLNPFWGLMPWKVFVPSALAGSYLISCLIFLKRKPHETEKKI
jgi:hypothetical protein